MSGETPNSESRLSFSKAGTEVSILRVHGVGDTHSPFPVEAETQKPFREIR